ncbi:hypothetical protein J2Y60_002188 [Arcicella sp. BE140]|nr:hypothetical protein [Arcicella sp. BE51]MDR6811989.1 hypothetical protein [Arcicella sp. BE140]MDR6823300.1 hypothetical protein [Arcicella sp. BE139]
MLISKTDDVPYTYLFQNHIIHLAVTYTSLTEID